MSIAGKLRVGIVGLGMGEDMLDALAKHPRVEVRALCDPLAARLHPLAAGYRVPGAYADFETDRKSVV